MEQDRPPAIAATLRTAGLRVTAPRVAVLEALPAHAHLSVEEIVASARRRLGSLSTRAACDNLDVLTQAGLVRLVRPAGSPARFEIRVGDNHHYAVCRSCGAMLDVDCVVGQPLCLVPSVALTETARSSMRLSCPSGTCADEVPASTLM